MAAEPQLNAIGHSYQAYKVSGTKFEVPANYTVLDAIGHGAYGVVCCAQNETTGEQVAIKKIENVFEDISFSKRTLRELRILRQLSHENIIDIQEIFIPLDFTDFSDVYVVSTLMETDLTSILRSDQPLNSGHCQFFLYQILRGCKYLHSASIIHRDLKPRNLLVNSNCDLRICDFGLARVVFPPEFQNQQMTEYVCTRWYRAPEILCCWSRYTQSIDVWSIGCIFAEMLTRTALFPGRNTKHQLELVIEKLGAPAPAELEQIENQKCRQFIESYTGAGREGVIPLTDSFPDANSEEIELVKAMLRFSPIRRATVEEAIRYAYMADMYCPEDEPTRDPLPEVIFEFERRKTGIDGLRAELFDEYLNTLGDQVKDSWYSMHERHDITAYRILQDGESIYHNDDE